MLPLAIGYGQIIIVLAVPVLIYFAISKLIDKWKSPPLAVSK